MSEWQLFAMGTLFGACLVLATMIVVAYALGTFSEEKRGHLDQQLLVAVRRLLLDPGHVDAKGIAHHLTRLRDLAERIDREEHPE